MQVTISCNSRCSGCVIKHVIDGDQRHAACARQLHQLVQPAAILAGIKHGRRQPGIAAKRCQHAGFRCSSGSRRGGMTISSRPSRIRSRSAQIRANIRLWARAACRGRAAGTAGHRPRDRADRPGCPACRRGRPAARRSAGAAVCGVQFLPGFIGAHHARPGCCGRRCRWRHSPAVPPARRIPRDGKRRAGRRNWW